VIDPVAEYDHDGAIIDPTTGSRAVTVGDVIRGWRKLPGRWP